ncbi:MAG: exodeoxyribonuclease VII large subunit, partial [Dehalococcoidia bacterium]|nr:exodeoxyribonuclease VII large subunit [Dehalococcoidia bacterium]
MPVYAVSQITAYLQASLESDDFLRDVWISGEVSNLSASGAGHMYFTLKDNAGQLRCVMFRSQRGREFLEKGAAVLAHGAISFYQTRGDLQFYVDLVQPAGVGELTLKLEQLKVKLQEEGLFEPSRKRSLPPFPHKIAVVTSPTGAVWHDIQNVIRRRYPLVELALAPTPVQGGQAAERIVEALQTVNQESDVDVVIIARGGGSLEELWPFNEEVVARAIYASRIPVVSGVGHETDVTIADLVADLRAPTPSAAAELVVPDKRQLQAEVLSWQ